MKLQVIYRFFAAASVLVGAAAAVAPQAAAATIIAGGRYGDVTVTKPAGPMRGFVVLFSREAGWSAADQASADTLAKAGALTVGVDIAHYAANLNAKSEACHQLAVDAEAISHQLERQSLSTRYFEPIVAGSGEGATLAKQVLAQAPSNTIAGAVSLDARPDAAMRFNSCPPPDYAVSRGTGLPGFFESAPAKAGQQEAQQLLALIEPHLYDSAKSESEVSDLPLVELPALHPNGMVAIVISGDGGWRDIDKTIGESLQKDGVSVVGWDSLRYFWKEKTPAEISHDLTRVLQAYSTRWQAKHVALIGYSFGANVIPFAYDRLPPALREKVTLVSLLGLAPSTDFQIRVTGWLGMPASDQALPEAPELARVPASVVQCFYGETEKETLCPSLAKTGAEVIRMPGDHHFGHDYGTVERRILDAFRKRSGLPGIPG